MIILRSISALLLLVSWPAATIGQDRAAPRSARELSPLIEQILSADPFENASWGLHIENVETGAILYSRNARRSFVPASNVKLFTTAAALDQLGTEFRYETDFWVDGPVVDGRLLGNLIVRGSGDPTIGARFYDGNALRPFQDLADSLLAFGIQEIEGDLIGDDDVFDDVPLGLGWDWDDEPFAYSAEIGGLVFDENVVRFRVRGTRPGAPASIFWESFSTSYVEVENATVTIHRDSAYVERYARDRAANRFVFRSRLPAGYEDTEALSIVNPTLYFVHTLREVLLQAGIAVHGTIRDIDELSFQPDYETPAWRRVAVLRSPPLKEIVRVINKESQNLYAEQVLKTLGARLDSTGIGSAEAGWRVGIRTLAAAGVDTSRVYLVDGSGLARRNLITPEMTVRLLTAMRRHPDPAVSAAFLESLPAAGRDGTLEYRFRAGSAGAGNARAKTGSMGSVRSLGGFVRTAAGSELVFSILCNHFTVPSREVSAAIDAIVNLLAASRL